MSVKYIGSGPPSSGVASLTLGQGAVHSGAVVLSSASPEFFWDDYVDAGSNDTVRMKAAIVDMFTRGAGILRMPRGYFVFDQPLDIANGARAQIRIPWTTGYVAGLTGPSHNFGICGVAPTRSLFENGSTSGLLGTVLKSTLTGQSFSGGMLPSLIGSEPSPDAPNNFNYNFLTLSLENLTIELPPNPTITAVDATNIATLMRHDVRVLVDEVYRPGATQPTNPWAIGFAMPGNGGLGDNEGSGCLVTGMYCGLANSSHTVVDRDKVAQCVVGLGWIVGHPFTALGTEDFNNADSHPSIFGHLEIDACNYLLAGLDLSAGAVDLPAMGSVVIHEMATERNTGDPWSHVVTEVKDGGNHLRGRIHYQLYPTAGTVQSQPLVITGCQNVELVDLTQRNLMGSLACATTDRPTSTTANLKVGMSVLDTTLHKLILWDGAQWRDTMGSVV